jgi:hypothetical protein
MKYLLLLTIINSITIFYILYRIDKIRKVNVMYLNFFKKIWKYLEVRDKKW